MQPLDVSTSEAIPQQRRPNELLFEGPDAIPLSSPELYVTLTSALALHAVPETEPAAAAEPGAMRPATASSSVNAPIQSRWRTMAYRNSNPQRQAEAEAEGQAIKEGQADAIAKVM